MMYKLVFLISGFFIFCASTLASTPELVLDKPLKKIEQITPAKKTKKVQTRLAWEIEQSQVLRQEMSETINLLRKDLGSSNKVQSQNLDEITTLQQELFELKSLWKDEQKKINKINKSKALDSSDIILYLLVLVIFIIFAALFWVVTSLKGRSLLAQLLLKLQKDELRTIHMNEAKTVKDFYKTALSYYKIHDYEKTLTLLNKALAENPKSVPALNLKGRVFVKLDQYEAAIELFDRVILLEPNNDYNYNNKGRALLKIAAIPGNSNLNYYKEAFKMFDKAIEINPKNEVALNNKGTSLANFKQYDEAIEMFDKAIEINPKDDFAWYNRASTYALLHNREDAMKSLKQAFLLNNSWKVDAKTRKSFKLYANSQSFKALF